MEAFTDEEPFCFNTGATSHISPIRANFAELNPIAPRSIKGVNGVAIPTIGTGLVKVRCRKGRNIMLKDALFAPQAALHLISIGHW